MSKVENQDSGMKRGLKDRHISMIAMGGVSVQAYL